MVNLNGRKIVVWGIGQRSLSAAEAAKDYFNTEISFFVSQEYDKIPEHLGKKVSSMTSLDRTKHFVVIGSTKYFNEISKELISLGFLPEEDFCLWLGLLSNDINTVFIEITNHCNMHCEFCPSDVTARKRCHIKKEYVLKLLREIREYNELNNNKIHTNFHLLGEPLINPNIFEYLDICLEYEIGCELLTNCTLLNDQLNRKLLSYSNIAIMLSVQTPTACGYKLRRYEKLDFESYMKKAFEFLEAKFKYKSKTEITVYLGQLSNASDKVIADTPFYLWDNFSDKNQESLELFNLIKKLKQFNEEMKQKYPEFYDSEFKMHGNINDVSSVNSHIFYKVEDLPDDWTHKIGRDGNWISYAFAPGVQLVSKPFGLWNQSDNFIRKAFSDKERFVYNEEAAYAIPCYRDHIGVLSDGTAVMCCFDYDGETNLGNICENKLEDIINCKKRTQITKDASFLSVCRKCKGKLFAFEKASLEGNVQEVLYGRGFLDYEDRHKINGKSAFAYVYTRIQASKIILELDFHNTNNIEFELCISEYEEDTDSFKNPDCKTITASENILSKIEITHDFKIGQFYRLEFNLISNTSKGDNKFKSVNMHSCTLKC